MAKHHRDCTDLKVILADREKKVRSALGLLFETTDNISILGEATHTDEILPHVCKHCPDILLIDWGLPGQALDHFLFIINMICPHLYVIALGLHPDQRSEALASGADAFVSKVDFPDLLLDTIEEICFDEKEAAWEKSFPVSIS